VLSDSHCDFQINKPSVFSRLSVASNSTKRWRSRKKQAFSYVEYPEVTANILGTSSTPRKSKGKQLAVSSEELDADQSPGLKDVLVEPEGVYRHTQTRTETISLSTTVCWSGGLRWMMSTLPSSNLDFRIPVRIQSPLLTWRELPRRLPSDLKSRPKFKGNNSIWFELSKNLLTPFSMLSQLLKYKRNRKVKLLLRSLKANRRKGRAYLLQILRVKSIPTLSHPNLHLKRRITQRTRAVILRGWANWSNASRFSQTETVSKMWG